MKNIVSLLFLFLSVSSCDNNRLTSISGLVYGTTYNIQFYSPTNQNFSKEIDSILAEIDNSMSTYKPNSIISRINNNDDDVLIDQHFKNVFHSSKKIFDSTCLLYTSPSPRD